MGYERVPWLRKFVKLWIELKEMFLYGGLPGAFNMLTSAVIFQEGYIAFSFSVFVWVLPEAVPETKI